MKINNPLIIAGTAIVILIALILYSTGSIPGFGREGYGASTLSFLQTKCSAGTITAIYGPDSSGAYCAPYPTDPANWCQDRGFTTLVQTCSVVPPASCTDSDGGQDEFVKGTTEKTGSFSYTDTCVDSTVLREYYCSGTTWGLTTIECPAGCLNGACVEQTNTCEPNAMRCNGQNREFCSSGGTWVGQSTTTCTDTGARCMSNVDSKSLCQDTIIADNYYWCKLPLTSCPTTCNPSTNACTTNACTANVKECVSPTQYRQCKSDGSQWLADVTCPSATPNCVGGTCTVLVCNANVKECASSTQYRQCNSQGTAWLATTMCPTSTPVCSGAGLCAAATCVSYVCKDNGNKWCINSVGVGIESTITPCAPGTEKCENGACIPSGTLPVPVLNPVTDITMKDQSATYDSARNKIVAKVTYTTSKSGQVIVEAGNMKATTGAQSIAALSYDSNYCNPAETWVANRLLTLATGVDYQITFDLTPKEGPGSYSVFFTACDKCKSLGTPVCKEKIAASVVVGTSSVCDSDSNCDIGETYVNCPNDCPVSFCDSDSTCDAGETTTSCPGDCKKSGYCYYASKLNYFGMEESCLGGSIVGGAGLLLIYLIAANLGRPRTRRRY